MPVATPGPAEGRQRHAPVWVSVRTRFLMVYRRLESLPGVSPASSRPAISPALIFPAGPDDQARQPKDHAHLHRSAPRPCRPADSLAAIPTMLETHGQWVRPGIMLRLTVPRLPDRSAESLGLQPVMTRSPGVIAWRDTAAGRKRGSTAVRTRTAEKPSLDRAPSPSTATAAGSRHAPTGTLPVLAFNDRIVPAGGDRVSMDMITLRISRRSEVSVGDEAVLWGEGLSATSCRACPQAPSSLHPVLSGSPPAWRDGS